MKIKSKLVVAITALATSHLVFAEDAAPDTPQIAVCPEPCIFPEAPEVGVLPFPIEKEDPAGRINIDPVILVVDPVTEPEIQPEVDPENQPEVDPVVDPEVDAPTDIDLSEGSDEKDGGGEVLNSGDPSDEVVTTLPFVETQPEKGEAYSDVVDRKEDEVSIKWLKRGDENFPVFYSTAANPVAAPEKAEAHNTLARELRQDVKAATIETKASANAPKMLSEKKEPVALIKKGRVFLH